MDCAIVSHQFLRPWSTCPNCHAVVEPRMITGQGPQGPLTGDGRGGISTTPTVVKRLEFFRWLAEKIGL